MNIKYKKWTTKRRFEPTCHFLVFLILVALAPLLPAKEVLTAQDFSYAGCFRVPKDVSEGGEMPFAKGLAHRYVDSELRFFLSSRIGPVYEFKAPETLSPTMEGAPLAVEVDKWPRLSVGNAYPEGLFWDSVDERLYFAGGDSYNTGRPYDPSVGFADVNKQVQGAWAFGDEGSNTRRSSKALQGGVLKIPHWFSDLYCPGKRLGAGFGGYYSIISTGPVSMGPALTAFDPGDMGSGSYVSQSEMGIPHTPLVGYDTENRAHRDTEYQSEFDEDDFNPENGVGYWTWVDVIHQGGEWVDTPNKSAVLFFASIGNGRVWYESSDRNGDGASHHVYFYDPEDLAAVAQGEKLQYEIQPIQDWKVEFPDIDYPMPAFRGGVEKQIKGVTFDPRANRLYVALAYPEDDINWMDNTPVVYAYDVNDEISNTVAGPPGAVGSINLQINTRPFSPLVSVTLTGSGFNTEKSKLKVHVYDGSGALVFDLTSSLKNGTAVWDASAIPNGTYWVRASSGNLDVSKGFTLLN